MLQITVWFSSFMLCYPSKLVLKWLLCLPGGLQLFVLTTGPPSWNHYLPVMYLETERKWPGQTWTEPGTEYQANIPHTERDDFSPQSCPALWHLTWIHSGECLTVILVSLGSKSYTAFKNHSLWAHLSEPHGHFWTGNIMWWQGKKNEEENKHICCGNVTSFRCKKEQWQKNIMLILENTQLLSWK